MSSERTMRIAAVTDAALVAAEAVLKQSLPSACLLTGRDWLAVESALADLVVLSMERLEHAQEEASCTR